MDPHVRPHLAQLHLLLQLLLLFLQRLHLVGRSGVAVTAWSTAQALTAARVLSCLAEPGDDPKVGWSLSPLPVQAKCPLHMPDPHSILGFIEENPRAPRRGAGVSAHGRRLVVGLVVTAPPTTPSSRVESRGPPATQRFWRVDFGELFTAIPGFGVTPR